ncbi:inactive dipeptidyl peptidase 10 [Arctopsyche grandis]|uniref:inactive dipeptidyl peptidase 10 n=1 Tax=Arctopsyche grandis TaxID=121162 RepID=UPI00406D8A1A
MQTNVQIDSKNLRPSPDHRPRGKGARSTVEELVASTPSQRNWRGILIALVVIAAVLGLIVFSIALLSPAGEGGGPKGRRPPLHLLLADRLRWPPFNGTWISDTELVFRDRFGGLAVMNADNLTTRLLMTNSTFRQLNAVNFKVASNLKYVLLISDERKVYRYTKLARYHVYEIATRNKFPLSPDEDDREAPLLQYAEWSPDGNAIVFVHENDIYYKPRVLKALVCRITNTGTPGTVFNGVPDFLYETEIIRDDHSLWFNSDGQYLMFVTYNDTNVGEHRWPWYGGDSPDQLRYPIIRSVRYPKANTNNPEVTIYTVNLRTPKFLFPHAVQPSSNVEPGSYVTYATWITDKQIALLFLNRVQNVSIISMCKANQFNCQDSIKPIQIYMERAQDGMWSTLGGNSEGGSPGIPPFIFARDGTALLVLLSVRDGDAGSYTHIGHLEIVSAMTSGLSGPRAITMGRFEVTQLVSWDEDNGFVYFIATPEKKPGQRHLYRIKLNKETITKKHQDDSTDNGQNDNHGGVWSDMSMLQCLTCPNESGLYQDEHSIEVTRSTEIYDTSIETTEDGVQNVTEASAKIPNNKTGHGGNNATHPMNATAKSYAHLNVGHHRNGVFYLNESVPNNCLYNNVIFSANNRYYVQECLGPESPSVYLAETLTNFRVAILHAGEQLRDRVNALAAPQIKTFQVEIQDGYHAQVRLYLPPGLREYEELPFPLILQVDASPGSQLVSEKFQVDWAWYLASTKNFIVAQIDGRGSGFQGDNLRKEIYHRFGTVEVEDQIAVLTYLRDSLKIIDSTRICVWGKGYGAHVVGMMTAQDSLNLTRCSVAIAPIVTWAYHNTFFTERYLGSGSSSGNYRGYEAADLARRAGNLAGRALLMATGTGDMTAPAQHSLALARALIHQGVIFRHQVYPDEDHEFSGSLYHLYKNIESFFDDCFGPMELNDWDLGGSFFTFKQ